jgi:hypothetical protein
MSTWRRTAFGDGSVTARARTSGHDWRDACRRAWTALAAIPNTSVAWLNVRAGHAAAGSRAVRSDSLFIACCPFERRRSRSRSRFRRIAEDLPQKGRQSAQRTDAGDSAGGDVLDAPEHAARRLRASVEMKYERSLRR